MRNKLVVAIGVVGVVTVVVALLGSRSSDPSHSAGTALSAGGSATFGTSAHVTTGHGDGSSRPTESHVRRLVPEERRRLAEQITAAIHRARASSAAASARGGAGAAGEDPIIPLEEASKPLQQALSEATSFLADCYKQQPGGAAKQTATAMMTMASDPDLGTVIDTDTIIDAEGKQIDQRVDECLRDTIDSLAFPPLGKAGKLQLQYSFRFDD
jgi:hypothetical protein